MSKRNYGGTDAYMFYTKPLTIQLKRLYLPDANIKIESAPYYE